MVATGPAGCLAPINPYVNRASQLSGQTKQSGTIKSFIEDEC
jgi:hypothetical protein